LTHTSTCRADALLAHQVLPAAGTYTLTLDPAGVSTGRATITLYTVVDVEGSVPDAGAPTRINRRPAPSR